MTLNQQKLTPKSKVQVFTSEEWTWLLLLMLGSVAFYLPFLARQFQGDDWLWLYNAKRSLHDASVIVGRPMYGYFRPLNMLLVMAQSLILGINATAFSLVSIVLHSLNTGFLWIVLRSFGLDLRTRNIAAFCFAFYFLNCSAIGWISVAHDLWVTLLCLIIVLKTNEVVDRPSLTSLVLIWLLAAAATLIKESGFVSIGLFVATLLVRGVSPLQKPYRWFSVFFALSFAAYLVGYTLTRTFVDREVSMGFSAFTNLWYFLVFMIIPLSGRMAELVPQSIQWLIGVLRIVTTLAFPLVAFHLWRRGGSPIRIALIWSVMFVSTFAIMDWEVGLFSLYTPRSIGRFMYSPVVGLAICATWLWVNEIESRLKILRTWVATAAIGALFLTINFVAVSKATNIYDENQDRIARIRADVQTHRSMIAQSDSIIVHTQDEESTREAIETEAHFRGLIYVDLDHLVGVRLAEKADSVQTPLTLHLYWDSKTKHLTL